MNTIIEKFDEFFQKNKEKIKQELKDYLIYYRDDLDTLVTADKDFFKDIFTYINEDYEEISNKEPELFNTLEKIYLKKMRKMFKKEVKKMHWVRKWVIKKEQV
ncbi:MAG: hypothetical protein [Caudoviricetes sp.]|nr:MAG: hypothetical protein [Caudoviricetes sp.]